MLAGAVIRGPGFGAVKVSSETTTRNQYMKEHNYYVYILTRERNSVFYVGVTNNLLRRVYEHKEGMISGFTKKYHVTMLVYYEHYNDVHEAIYREKAIKK